MMARNDDQRRVKLAHPSDETGRFCLICCWPVDDVDRCQKGCRMNAIRINGEPERSN